MFKRSTMSWIFLFFLQDSIADKFSNLDNIEELGIFKWEIFNELIPAFLCTKFVSKYLIRFFNLYINLACLFVCLSVCLFVSNKRQNGWTDRAQFFCGTSRTPGKVYESSKFQIFVSIKIRSSLNFWKFWKSANYFCFVLRCTQREHVHN